jgi:N-acyl-D-amino-acid deacylase
MFDILVKDGVVLDGTGAPSYGADVAIRGDAIASIGVIPTEAAARVIEARGCVVAPGFIDMHSHGDFALPLCPLADSLIHQGVTSAVIGQCGASMAPLMPRTRSEVVPFLQSNRYPLPWEAWSDFGSYLGFLGSLGVAINLVPLAGQGTIRAGVMGFSSEAPSPEQMRAMQTEAVRAMEAGAIGVSTGLIYPPGSYATPDELVELIRPVGERNGFYFSHIRGEGATLIEALNEAIRIGKETGAAVHISHLKASWPSNWHKQSRALGLIDEARAQGLDITADAYPYLAGATGLKSTLPGWAQEGNKEVILARLADPVARARMIREMGKEGFAGEASWDRVRISRSPARPEYTGRYVSEVAVEAGKGPEQWVLDALIENHLGVGMIVFMISEENLRVVLKHPVVSIGTDATVLPTEGPLAQGLPHPRAFGTFPRVLARYVRDQGVLTLAEAVHKMTGLPARKLRLSDRGMLREGFKADLVVFDPEKIEDRATFDDPFQHAVGIHHVICNGAPVIAEGRITGARPGRVLGR